MNTKIVKTEDGNEDEVIREAGEILKSGGLVAFPTETVYGLGGDALKEDAARRIYSAKGRPSDNPLIVHIADIGALDELASEIPECAYKLAEAFWPGPLTMIFKKKDIVPYGTTGGLDTVAIRMPSHHVAHRLIKDSGVYIAAPSANLSGRPSPTRAEHVIEDMDGRIDMIIDGGAIEIGIESTIVDVTCEVPMILRPGYVTADMIKEVLGDVCFDETVLAHSMVKGKPKAPGMKYRHYAPKAELTIFEGENEKVVSKINELAVKYEYDGLKVGILSSNENEHKYAHGEVVVVGSRENEHEVAAHLFDVLRHFDHIDVDVILSEGFSEDSFGQAVMNRLIKAAGHHIEIVE
ncbi:sua5/YciO/YrdC/YwlC family protein [Firmicutes bacterium CAG:882]|nr:sua5/YciO/YrdC/YwlC family protein [Firmicutes bacterium CAG:882]